MEKELVVKRVGDFSVVGHYYPKRLSVDVMIGDDLCEMIFVSDFSQGATLMAWKRKNNDTCCFQKDDFGPYKFFGIKVNYESVRCEAAEFFAALKQAEKEEKEREETEKRSLAYDEHYMTGIAKELIKRGHSVAATSKRDFVAGRDFRLMVDERISVGSSYDHRGWVVAHNEKYGENRVETKTRSAKTEKIVKTIEDAVRFENARRQRLKEKSNNLKSVKSLLEGALGVPLTEEKEYRSNGQVGRSHRGWDEIYFTDASKSVRIKPNRVYDNDAKRWVDGFSITYMKVVESVDKLKKIYEAMKS